MAWKVGITHVGGWPQQRSEGECDDQSHHESTHVGKVCYTSHSLLHSAQRCYTIKQLQHEPYADQDDCWQRHNGEENEEEDNGSHTCPWKQHQVGRHTPAIAPLAPRLGMGEFGAMKTCVRPAMIPHNR